MLTSKSRQRGVLLVFLCFFWIGLKVAEGCGPTHAAVGGAIHGLEGLHGLHALHGCLSVTSTVTLPDGRVKSVGLLAEGDMVMTFDLVEGAQASKVVAILNDYPETDRQLAEIVTSSGRALRLTPQHSLFVKRCMSDDVWSPKMAGEVKPGECLPAFDLEDGQIFEDSVVNVSLVYGRGIRQPITERGTIVADRLLVSCYDRVISQKASHLALTYYLWLTRAAERLSDIFSGYTRHSMPALLSAFGLEKIFY